MCLSWRPLHSLFISYWFLIWSLCHLYVFSFDRYLSEILYLLHIFVPETLPVKFGKLVQLLACMIWVYKCALKLCYKNWISFVFSLLSYSYQRSWAFWLSWRMTTKILWELWVFLVNKSMRRKSITLFFYQKKYHPMTWKTSGPY